MPLTLPPQRDATVGGTAVIARRRNRYKPEQKPDATSPRPVCLRNSITLGRSPQCLVDIKGGSHKISTHICAILIQSLKQTTVD